MDQIPVISKQSLGVFPVSRLLPCLFIYDNDKNAGGHQKKIKVLTVRARHGSQALLSCMVEDVFNLYY